VKELLREHEESGDFLDTPAVIPGAGGISEETETLMARLKPEEAGDRIGAYKLLEQIGEGGFGIVWMAEQEQPVRRQVALKIIKVGMDTKQVIARFEQERQALAIMEHPNIAKVYDAGATPFGRPFFVMELVRGIPITEYCDEARLTTRQRLMLFIRVCEAVQHAHQKGIIHRDLKPTNVLVTLHDGVPVPKVIDFGVAKAMQERLTEMTLFTGFEQMLGTPLYMSPEQAEMSGLDIDTRSDIYALGILLYELLTGRTPLNADEFRKQGVDEMRRAIREEEPLRPSMLLRTMPEATRTKVAKFRESELPMLVRSMRGDLDWIVMKALEKDRTRRYETASDLARDVQRHLDSEPVLARPPTRRYRLQKLIRRHRGAFTAALLVVAALLVGSGVSIWQAVRATSAEGIARAAQKQEAMLRAHAERESAAARLNEYDADIALAAQSFTDGNYRRGVRLLEKHRPVAGAPDLRGFEWRYLWQVAQGGEHFALPDQGSPVQSLSFSPSGDALAIASQEKINVWNVRGASAITTLPRSTGGSAPSPPMGPGPGMFRPSRAAAFLPGGKLLITGSGSGVRIWSTETWTEQRALAQSGGSFALSDDGKLLAASRRGRPGQGGVTVWDTATWAELRTFASATSPMAFAPGRKVFAGTTNEGIILWPLEGDDGKVTLSDSASASSHRGPGGLTERTLAFSPDGKFIAAARNTPSERGVFVVSIWDAASGAELSTLPTQPQHIEHTGVISAIAFSPDGRTLATGSLDHSVRLWDFAKRERIATLHGHLTEVWALAFSSDGETLATGGKGGEVKLWPAHQQQKADPLSGISGPLAISPDGQTLIASAGNDAIGLYDVSNGELLKRLELEATRFRGPALAVSADTRVLAHALQDGRVKFWDTATGESRSLKASDRSIDVLALSPDGAILITGAHDETLRWWTLSTGASEQWPIKPMRVRFSPDGRTLAAYHGNSAVELWDIATRTLRVTLESQSEFGGPGAFSPDGRLFAMPSQEDTIRLWDVFTGATIGTFAGHKQPVLSIAFSPDGRTLASSGDDSTVRMWNVTTQQELLVDRRLGGSLTNLLFSPDGRLLLGSKRTPGRGGGLQVYRAPLFTETVAAMRPE
jgi:WD40 repeat protein/serine/threonine protein kinase